MKLFPEDQRRTVRADGRMQCNAKARINKKTGRWEEFDCQGKLARRLFDFCRHSTSAATRRTRGPKKKAQTDVQGKRSICSPLSDLSLMRLSSSFYFELGVGGAATIYGAATASQDDRTANVKEKESLVAREWRQRRSRLRCQKRPERQAGSMSMTPVRQK